MAEFVDGDDYVVLGDHFNWVTEELAVGDFYASSPPECWDLFSAILNLSEMEHPDIGPPVGCGYLWIPFPDGDDLGFRRALPTALHFLAKHQGKKILVHCAAGVSRSVSMTLARMCQLELERGEVDPGLMERCFANLSSKRSLAYPCQRFVKVVGRHLDLEIPDIGW